MPRSHAPYSRLTMRADWLEGDTTDSSATAHRTLSVTSDEVGAP